MDTPIILGLIATSISAIVVGIFKGYSYAKRLSALEKNQLEFISVESCRYTSDTCKKQIDRQFEKGYKQFENLNKTNLEIHKILTDVKIEIAVIIEHIKK